MTLVSWACRKCSHGNWGETMPKVCKDCGDELVQTGTIGCVKL